MMFCNGGFICFGTNVGFMYGNLKGTGLGSGGIALIGGDFIFFGVISAFFVGIILRMTKKNLLILRLCVYVSFLIMIIEVVCIIEEVPHYYLQIVSIFIGICFVPITPVLINFAGEVTFP